MRDSIGLSAAIFLAVAASGATAAEKPAAGTLQLVVVDGDVPKSLIDRTSAELAAGLSAAFVVAPESELARVREGTELPPDLSDAAKLIEQGKSHASYLRYKPATQAFHGAKVMLGGKLSQLRDYQLYLEAIAQLGALLLVSGNKQPAAAEFSQLLLLRPDYQLNATDFSPAVLEFFDGVRKKQSSVPRGRLTVTSEPAGAQVFIDERAEGVTPMSLVLPAGDHQLRLALTGRSAWTEKITVAAYAKLERKADLPKHPGAEALEKLEAALAAGGTPAEITAHAAKVAEALDVPGLIVAGVGLTDEAYLLSVAWLSRTGAGRAVAVTVDTDPAKVTAGCEGALQELAKQIAEPLPPDSTGKVLGGMLGGAAAGRVLDYGKYGLGLAPGMPPARKVAIEYRDATVKPTPLYTRWWVWVGAVAVVGAAAGGSAYYVVSRPPPPPSARFVVERQ